MTRHAYEMEYTKPARRGFFYAMPAVLGFYALVLIAALMLAGCDSAAAVGVQEADSRRDLAAAAMCGKDAAPEWLDAVTVQCMKHKEAP